MASCAAGILWGRLLLARSSRWALNGLGVLWVGLVDCFGRSIGCDPFLLDMLGLIFMGCMGSLPPPLESFFGRSASLVFMDVWVIA